MVSSYLAFQRLLQYSLLVSIGLQIIGNSIKRKSSYWDRDIGMAIECRPHAVFRSNVSCSTYYPSPPFLMNIIRENLPGISGSAFLQVLHKLWSVRE